jgi:hypothetical protein
VVCGACLSFLMAAPVAAAAGPEGGAGSEAAAVIVLDDELDGAARELLEQSLRELLARIDLQLGELGITPDDDVVARVSIELSADAAIVSVSSPRDAAAPERYRVERTSDELFRETLAHVILAAVEPRAALRREPPAASPGLATEPEIERQAPEPPPARDAAHALDARSRWSLGAHGGALRVAKNGIGAAWGASVAVALRVPGRPSAALEASYLVPVRVRGAEVAAQLSRFGLRVRARAEPLSSERMALELGLAGGMDVIALTPESLPPEQSGGRSTRPQATLGGSFAGRLRLTERFDLVARVGADLELFPRRWSLVSDSESEQFYATPRWLSYATLGFEWGLGGAREGVAR